MIHNEDKNQLIVTGLLSNYVLYAQEGGGKSYGRCQKDPNQIFMHENYNV